MISTEEIVRATGGVLLNGDMGICFSGVTQDSRRVTPGNLFVALAGPRFDGHDYVLQAIEAGARGALVSYWPENINIFELHRAISVIKVPDTLKALGDLAAYYRRKKNARVLALTGSCGKTSTKEFLATLLGVRNKVYKNPGNWNNLIGLPLSILNVADEDTWVLELGTSFPGEIARLTEIASPEIALLLGVKPAHLEGLETMEKLLQEKLALFEEAPRAYWVYPADQEEIKNWVLAQNKDEKISFGFCKDADVRGEVLEITPQGTKFKLEVFGKSYEAFIPLLGKHFVFDVLGALAACLAAGEEIETVLPRLKDLKTIDHRLQLRKIGPFYVIDDAYNANPGSFAAACEVLSAIGPKFSKVIAAVGDMKELGDQTEAFHKEVGRRLASVCDEVYAVGKFALWYQKGGGDKVKTFAEKEALYAALKKNLVANSLLLVKGSRAAAMEEIIAKLEEEEA